MQIVAKLNYLRIAPRKVRALAGLLAGKRLPEAERILRFSTRRPARPLQKLLASAAANAKHNFQVSDREGLVISEIRVDQGPTLKRVRPRAMGRAFPIRKKTSHVSLVLETSAPAPAPSKRPKPAVRVLAKAGPEAGSGEEARKPAHEREPRTSPAGTLRGEAFRARPKAVTKPTEFVKRFFRRKAI